MTVSRSGHWVAATRQHGYSSTVVADPTQVRQVKELKHNRPLFATASNPSGSFICTGAQDKLVARWDVNGDELA